jgi:hypothetical protein
MAVTTSESTNSYRSRALAPLGLIDIVNAPSYTERNREKRRLSGGRETLIPSSLDVLRAIVVRQRSALASSRYDRDEIQAAGEVLLAVVRDLEDLVGQVPRDTRSEMGVEAKIEALARRVRSSVSRGRVTSAAELAILLDAGYRDIQEIIAILQGQMGQ